MNFSSEEASGVDVERDCCEFDSDCCKEERTSEGEVGDEEVLRFCVIEVWGCED